MKKHILSLVAVSAMLLTACQKEDVASWEGIGYAWFTAEKTEFSFLKHSEVAEGQAYDVPLQVTIAGDVADYDRQVNVEISRQPQCSGTSVKLPSPASAIVKAGENFGTINISVVNTPNLNTDYDTVQFRIIESPDFLPGIKDSITTVLCLHNGYPRPSWWGTSGGAVGKFGYFTDLKMQVYMTVVEDDSDPSGGNSWYSSLYIEYLQYKLNDYVEKNGIVYPEGTIYDDPWYGPTDCSGMAPSFSSYSF